MKRLLLLLLFLLCSKTAISADFNKYFPHLLKAEGLIFTVTQYDRGGATKFGVTITTFKIACAKAIALNCDKNADKKVNAIDLGLTTPNDIKPIYKSLYWQQALAESIENQAIAEAIVDILVNCGPGRNNAHIKAIQKAVNAKQDGKIGKETIRKINQSNPSKLYKKIFDYRAKFYKRIGVGKQQKFLRGWLNRINQLKQIHKNERYIV